MKQLVKTLGLVAVIAVLSPGVKAETPNINKRGDDEKAFVKKLAAEIVKQARTSINKDKVTLEKFEKKSPKEGRTEWHIKADFPGAATGKEYTAEIVVLIDTSDKEKWEVLRIDYSDNSKSVVGYNRKNVEAMVKKLNEK
jgi:hypothetical protein